MATLTHEILFAVAATCALCGCGNGSSSDPGDPNSTGSGGFVTATGGAAGLGGAAGSAAVSSGGITASGGAPDLPAGQLSCGGRLCRTGGHCTTTGLCPGFFSDCFTHSAGLDTCDVFCQSKGLTCAARACNSDGTGFDPPQAYTWASYPASRSAECGTSAYPALFGQDECIAPIWQNGKPDTDVVRCCCR
jgi:hypothetical protein